MDSAIRKLVGVGAICAPLLHSITDVMEWFAGGFSAAQLWLNYLAFLPLPIIVIGLWAAQRPAIGWMGLIGAVLYGFAFIYFTHTTLLALTQQVGSYDELWSLLGPIYTVHGAVMIVGGALFGIATFRARVYPAWTAALFLAGLAVNSLLTSLPVDDIYQTAGTALRNVGLIGMGWSTLQSMERRQLRGMLDVVS